MNLPAQIQQAIESHLNTQILRTERVGGGDINESARIQTVSERFFVKWHPHSPAGMFAAEARGLAILAATHTLKVPQVMLASDNFLVLEWLEMGKSRGGAMLAERLGEGLAALHQHTHAQHGLDHDNFIGRLPQSNTFTTHWAEFYRDQRIGAQMNLARQHGLLQAEREKLLTRLCEKLPQILPNTEPALLHGDLWGGNYSGIVGDIPVMYDPAVYYGHREVEIAFTELFGGFPARFYEAYNAVFPLEAGYTERKALYQLYPLLVHWNLFGESYGTQVDSIARLYVG